MHFLTIIFIAIGLAMDCLAVSVTSGFTIKNLRIGHALQIAFFFGFFQAFMPVVGWLAGLGLRGFITDLNHWAAFVLLSLVGGKMIYESRKLPSEKKAINPLNIYILLILSMATSIDALAVGVSFAFLGISFVTPVLVIGTVTFLFSFFGVFAGNRVGHFFENKMELAGGLILIGIGAKILLEHLA